MTLKPAHKLLSDGVIAQGIVLLDDAGDLVHQGPILQQALIGNAHNYYPEKQRGFVFGKRSGIGNTRVTLWGGPTVIYTFPPSPMQMSIASTSAADASGGTGVRSVRVHYLDAAYAPKVLDVTLTGITPVLLSDPYILRINNVHAIAVGSGGVAAGAISIVGSDTITYAHIAVGENTARQAVYTVPGGYDGYINHWQASSGSAGNHFCQTILNATTHDGQEYPGVMLVQDEVGTQNGGVEVTFPIPIRISQTTDVVLSAISDANNAEVTALGAIMGWFEPAI